jgi:hypothetical protein
VGPVTDPVITYETRPAPALQFLVNFGVFTGREATRLDLHRLADRLLAFLPSVTVLSERRFELSARTEGELHQVRVEVAHDALPPGREIEILRVELTQVIQTWAHACRRSLPGELTEAEISAREAVAEINDATR